MIDVRYVNLLIVLVQGSPGRQPIIASSKNKSKNPAHTLRKTTRWDYEPGIKWAADMLDVIFANYLVETIVGRVSRW